MNRARTKLIVLFVVAAAVIVLLRFVRGGKENTQQENASADLSAAEEGLIDGRVWVEGRPDKMTDYVHGAFFFTRANFGIFERASAYDIRFEMFDMSRSKGTLKVHFPQTKKDRETTFTVKECKDKPPFDLCLDVADNPWGGPKRYYAFQNPEDEKKALGDYAARVRALQPEK